jgi:hypothetical protein
MRHFWNPICFSEKPMRHSEYSVSFPEKPMRYSEYPVSFSEKPMRHSEYPVSFPEKPMRHSEYSVSFPEKSMRRFWNPICFSEKPMRFFDYWLPEILLLAAKAGKRLSAQALRRIGSAKPVRTCPFSRESSKAWTSTAGTDWHADVFTEKNFRALHVLVHDRHFFHKFFEKSWTIHVGEKSSALQIPEASSLRQPCAIQSLSRLIVLAPYFKISV